MKNIAVSVDGLGRVSLRCVRIKNGYSDLKYKRGSRRIDSGYLFLN